MGSITRWLRLYFVTLVSLAAPSFAAELEPKLLRDFSRGLVTSADPTIIPDGAAQDLENVDVSDGSISKRRGTIKTSSSEIGEGQGVRFLHEYVDAAGTFWLLSVSSNTIYQSNDGGATNSVGTSALGISATTRFQATNAFGKAYFVSGTTNTITFNGTSFSANTSAPLGTVTAFYAGRLWIANLSTLYGSRVNDDTDWTDDGVADDDAFIAVVRSQDGYAIKALVPYGPDLLVFKTHSIDRLSVNGDGVNFSLIPVTSNLGTNFPETVKVGENRVIWLAHDGFYSYNGSVIKRISENIQPSIENLNQLSAASRSYTETTQTQFQVGASSGVSPNVALDSVALSTWTDTDTTGDDFAAGSLTNVTTQTVSGALYLSTNNTNVENNGFENGTTTNPDNWTGNARINDPSLVITGTWSAVIHDDFGANILVQVLDASSSLLGTIATIPTGTIVSTSPSISLAAYAGRNIRLRFTNAGLTEYQLSDVFLCSGGDLSFTIVGNTFFDSRYRLDDVTGGRSTIYSGSFTSQSFDTTFSTPAWLPSTPTYSANGHTLTWQTQTSDDNSTWDTAASWTPGSAPTSAQNRYIRYLVSIATATAGTGMPFISDVTLAARNTSGRYLSPAITLSGASGWAPFAANQVLNDGSITYEVYTDTDTTMPLVNGVPTQFVSSQTITAGNTPTISTAAFARVASTFTITAATQAPQMDDFTLSWSEGDSSLFPAAIYWDRDYYCALAVNETDENDTVFVFDKNDSWTKYTGLPVRSMATYRTRPYFGTADAGWIVRMQVENRYRDYDDAAISAFWTSKDFDFGYPLTTKTLYGYYLTGERAVDGNLTFAYGVERGTLVSSSYSLNETGFFREVIKPSSLTYSEGLQHRFKFSDATLDGPFTVLSLTGRWRLNTNP